MLTRHLHVNPQGLKDSESDQERQKGKLVSPPDPLPAGGADPTRFDWQAAWYPVHYVEDLNKTKLTRFTLLDQNLVIWWDKMAKTWRAFEDKCPHRLAPLSEGRISEDGLLECPYHGWAFAGSGDCKRIPQQVEGRTAEESMRACAASLPTVVRQGLLFVYPGKPENAAKTSVPIVELLEEGLDDASDWVCINTFRDLPYDTLTLLENVLDPSHLPYTHHRSVGDRGNAGPVELEVVESGKQGFKGVWQEGPRRGKLGRQDTTFIAPGLMWHDLTSKQFGRTLTVVYATPISKGRCRLFARFPFKFPSKIPSLFIKLTPRWYSHIGQNAILEDDQIFLHHQERFKEQAGGGATFAKAFYLPTRADRFVVELHKWIKKYKAVPFPGEPLPSAWSRAKLLDRYHSHTVHCVSCQTALANIQRLRKGALAIAMVIWAMAPLLAVSLSNAKVLAVISSTVTVLVLGAVWVWLGKLERQFYQGRTVPPRNLPEK